MPTTPSSIGLYVHIPWCVRKCPYCDFNSHPLRGELPESAYIDRVVTDLNDLAPRALGRPIATVFFGGGTPSLMSATGIGRLLEAADRLIGFAPEVEITLEANPGTVEHDTFSGYRDAGVNRISLGVQSFDGQMLERLGRIHSSDEASRAAEAVYAAGIGRLNIDLMYGLPQQSVDGALADVRQALRLSPEHLSHYQLTLEPNTAFARTPPTLPDDEATAAMADTCRQAIEDAGLHRYEVSAYARPGAACRHNVNYWQFGDYLGVGAGAHGKLTTTDGVYRHHWAKHPRAYLVGDGERFVDEKIAPTDLPFEFMMNALRLDEGVSSALFTARTGLAASSLEPALGRLRSNGLLEMCSERLQPTALGLAFLNDVLTEFLPAPGR